MSFVTNAARGTEHGGQTALGRDRLVLQRPRNAAAAAPTTGVVPAAADEVSAPDRRAVRRATPQLYQGPSPRRAAAIHEQFVNTLGTSAGSYAATEASQRRQPAG